MQHLRLTHPALDFWIDVRIREFDGRWLAVADLASTPDVGRGEGPEETLRGALAALGPRLAVARRTGVEPPTSDDLPPLAGLVGGMAAMQHLGTGTERPTSTS